MAKRGCAPRSIKTTERPRRRHTIASKDPAKPEPTIATSKERSGSPTRSPAGAARHRCQDGLSEVHRSQSARSRAKAGAASAKTFEVPQVGQDSTAVESDASSRGLLERREVRRREFSPPFQRIHRAVAGACRNE